MPNAIATCESCGTPWVDHTGQIDTCRQLQAAKAEIKRLRAWIATERKDTMYGPMNNALLFGMIEDAASEKKWVRQYEAETKRILEGGR